MCNIFYNNQKKPLNILLIGSLPPPIGGISVSFSILADLLSIRNDVSIQIVDLGILRRSGRIRFFQLLSFVRRLVSVINKADVVTMYVASTALPTLGFIVLLISRLQNKPFIIRKAAGFDYYDLGVLLGGISHFVIKKCDLYLAQTKKLVRLAQERGVSHVQWYPTSRVMDDCDHASGSEQSSCRRFVFISQVRRYKGVHELIEAGERFGREICVDVYGPLFDDIDVGVFDKCKTVTYRGLLSPEEVISTMKQYDMLLLPTKAPTEGYPGVVFEGYSAGLPIITTRCGGIPEIVDETCGIFVEKGSVDSLYKAMKNVVDNKELYQILKEGAKQKRKEFDAEIWADKFVEYCEEVYRKSKISV